MKMGKKAQGLAIGNMGKIVLILILIFVVAVVIFGPRFLKLKADTQTINTNALLRCIDKTQTPAKHLASIMPYAAKKMKTGEVNPLYEPKESAKLAFENYKNYYACRYKTKVFNIAADQATHDLIVACGKASLINLYMDYDAAEKKSADRSEKAYYKKQKSEVERMAKSVGYTGSLKDENLASKCTFDSSLKL